MSKNFKWAKEALAQIQEKMSWCSIKNKGKIPYTTDLHGDYDNKADDSVFWTMDDGINWWTNGFWGGLMWLMYQYTGQANYKEAARLSEKQLDRCFQLFEGLHHDVGFMYMLTAIADYRLTRNSRSRVRGMHAASLLAGRYNPSGRFLRAWNENYGGDPTGRVIIDSMMNLSLLYWASKENPDPRFRQIAMNHADTVMQNFIREDGSVRHIVDFDPITGVMLGDAGGQGYGIGSSWVRGQAWAVYGFTISYRHTGKEAYLETAKKVASYCVSELPEDGVLPIDFRQPKSPSWEDSCGAVILAGGFLELSRHVAGEDREQYLHCACKILRAITEKRADFSRDCDAIVQKCSAAYHDERHHFPMVYADYFYTEALLKLTMPGIFMW